MREIAVKVLGGGTYLCSKNFFASAVSQTSIFVWRGQLQKLQLKINYSQIWLDARKIYNQHKEVGEINNSKNYFLESHFRAFTPRVFLTV